MTENNARTDLTPADKPKRKRKHRTPEQRIADLQAEIAKLEAKKNGTYDPTQEGDTMSRLRAALRRRQTVLKEALMLRDGRPGTAKSPALNPLEVKIQNAEERLERLTRDKAIMEKRVANLPGDIERLELLIDAAEKGEEVEMPTDLLRLSDDDKEPSDARVEANHVNKLETATDPKM